MPGVRSEAARRENANRGSRTNRPLAKEAEKLGVAGEYALAWLAGIWPYDPKRERVPWTMRISDHFRVKITTSLNPRSLLVKEGRVEADVYILAGCSSAKEIEPWNVYFVGWAHSSMVREARVVLPRDGKGDVYAQAAHKIEREHLLEMKRLLPVLGIPLERLDLPYPVERGDIRQGAIPLSGNLGGLTR